MPPSSPTGRSSAFREVFVSFWEGLSHEVAQAVGMVSAQAKCSAPQALELIEDRARRQRQTVDDIAKGVLDRSIRFQ